MAEERGNPPRWPLSDDAMKTRACRERGGEEEPRIQLPSLDLVCLGQRGRRGRREGQSPRGNHESADHVARMAMICAPPLWPAMRYTLSLRGVVCSAVCSREIARAERAQILVFPPLGCGNGGVSARTLLPQGARLRAMSNEPIRSIKIKPLVQTICAADPLRPRARAPPPRWRCGRLRPEGCGA